MTKSRKANAGIVTRKYKNTSLMKSEAEGSPKLMVSVVLVMKLIVAGDCGCRSRRQRGGGEENVE